MNAVCDSQRFACITLTKAIYIVKSFVGNVSEMLKHMINHPARGRAVHLYLLTPSAIRSRCESLLVSVKNATDLNYTDTPDRCMLLHTNR